MSSIDRAVGLEGVGLDYEAARRLLAAASDPGMGDAEVPPLPGYQTLGTVGRGGSATAYLACRPGSEELLVIKVLRPGGGAGSASQVMREWAMLRRVRLECLPRVVECGEVDGRPYLVREYVEGRTLGEAMDAIADDRERARLMARLCAAVSNLHEHGLLHRDLTPANIVLRDDGGIALIDLGLAGLDEGAGAEQTVGASGVGIGTPAYMPPEQARGQWSVVSVKSDVFGLGAVGYVLWTGQTAHAPSESVPEALHRAATQTAREPRLLRADIPAPIAAVLRKACASAIEERYSSAAAMGEEFDRWLRGEPVSALPRSRWRRVWGWLGRHPAAAAVAATVLVCAGLIGGSLGAVWWMNGRPSHVEWGAGEREARLVSRGGRVFRQVGGGSTKVTLANLVQRPATMGGGWVWVTLAMNDPLGGVPAQVAVWQADSPERPLWTSGDGPVRVPAAFLDSRATSFVVRDALVANVLPEPDGHPAVPEIVVAMTDVHYYPSVIRVLDLSGSVRCEVWHKGQVRAMRWLEGPRQLVCMAAYNGRSLESLGVSRISEAVGALGGKGVELGTWPTVVFALEPRESGSQVVDVPFGDGRRVEEVGMLSWYAWPKPLDFWASGAVVTLEDSKGSGRRGGTVTLMRAASGGDYQAVVDGQGRLVDDVWSDAWRAAAGKTGLNTRLKGAME